MDALVTPEALDPFVAARSEHVEACRVVRAYSCTSNSTQVIVKCQHGAVIPLLNSYSAKVLPVWVDGYASARACGCVHTRAPCVCARAAGVCMWLQTQKFPGIGGQSLRWFQECFQVGSQQDFRRCRSSTVLVCIVGWVGSRVGEWGLGDKLYRVWG